MHAGRQMPLGRYRTDVHPPRWAESFSFVLAVKARFSATPHADPETRSPPSTLLSRPVSPFPTLIPTEDPFALPAASDTKDGTTADLDGKVYHVTRIHNRSNLAQPVNPRSSARPIQPTRFVALAYLPAREA